MAARDYAIQSLRAISRIEDTFAGRPITGATY